MPQPSKTFASWYVESDWPEWLALCPDMKSTYREWLDWSEKQLPQFRARGMVVEPITIRPAGFAKWSKEQGRGLLSGDRAAYAVMVGLDQTDASVSFPP